MLLRDALTPMLFRRGRLLEASLLDRRANEQFLEALIAVGLVAMLAAMAASAYSGFAWRTTLTESVSLIGGFRVDVVSYHALTGEFPGDDVSVLNTARFGSRYFSAADWQDQEIVLTVEPVLAGELNGSARTSPRSGAAMDLSWRPASSRESGALIMLCGLAEAPAGFEARPPRHTSVPTDQLPHYCRP